MTPDLKKNNYFSAINIFIESYQSDVEAYQFIDRYTSSQPNPYQFLSSDNKLIHMILESIGVGILVAIVMLYFSYSNYKTIRKATAAGSYIKPGSFTLTVKEDKYVRSHTDKTYSPEREEREEREHRSYSSYDSDTHSSSSGRPFGGGSGSF